jgi:hypothetical protein
MISINAHFDGKVIVPDEPLDLPRDEPLIVRVEPKGKSRHGAGDSSQSSLEWLLQNASDDPALPNDLAHQHDHYLYGRPKRDA